MTRRDDITDFNQSTGRLHQLDETLPEGLADSRMIGDLLCFKNRDGRFVILENLLDFLTNTKRLPGLDCFRIDKATCLFELRNQKAPCDVRWTFGDSEQWKADQCCGILALHKTNWTAGKRISEADTFRWAISDRVNRLLVLCLPPEGFVATHEQTWEAVCEGEPWKAGRDTALRSLIRSIPDGSDWKILKSSDDKGDGINEPEIDEHSSMGVVRKSVLAPQVTEWYVRLSHLGDVLPWLREKALPVAVSEDASLAQAIAQCIAHIERRTAALADGGSAAAREAEICQKIEIEIAFRNRLVAALDKEGYIVKSGMTPEKQEREFLRKNYENELDRSKMPWTFFFAHSKDESAALCLAVWFSSDVPTPYTFKWRPLDIEGMSVAGPFKRKKLDGVSYATPPLGYHVSIIDSRLRFEDLPIPVMRDTLLDGHLAEELASKVAVAFDRISALHAD